MKLGIYGDIGSTTCGGYVGFNISAAADPVQDAKVSWWPVNCGWLGRGGCENCRQSPVNCDHGDSITMQ
jgi:hypothetical protein